MHIYIYIYIYKFLCTFRLSSKAILILLGRRGLDSRSQKRDRGYNGDC